MNRLAIVSPGESNVCALVRWYVFIPELSQKAIFALLRQFGYRCFCFLPLLMQGCSDENKDLIQYITQIKQRKTQGVESLPAFSSLEVFKFPEDESRRNPFTPQSYRKQNDLSKQPLEAFPLDALKFVGTLSQENETWALIKQPDEQIIPVRVGDYMGQSQGRILSINNHAIQLEETAKSLGQWEKHRITLSMSWK